MLDVIYGPLKRNLIFHFKIICEKVLSKYRSNWTNELGKMIKYSSEDNNCKKLRELSKPFMERQTFEALKKFFLIDKSCFEYYIEKILRSVQQCKLNTRKENILQIFLKDFFTKKGDSFTVKINKKNAEKFKKYRSIFIPRHTRNFVTGYDGEIIRQIKNHLFMDDFAVINQSRNINMLTLIRSFQTKYMDNMDTTKVNSIISKINEEVNILNRLVEYSTTPGAVRNYTKSIKILDEKRKLFNIFKFINLKFGHNSNLYRILFSFIFHSPEITKYQVHSKSVQIFVPNFFVKVWNQKKFYYAFKFDEKKSSLEKIILAKEPFNLKANLNLMVSKELLILTEEDGWDEKQSFLTRSRIFK